MFSIYECSVVKNESHDIDNFPPLVLKISKVCHTNRQMTEAAPAAHIPRATPIFTQYDPAAMLAPGQDGDCGGGLVQRKPQSIFTSIKIQKVNVNC